MVKGCIFVSSNKPNTDMKTLLIEKTTIGSSESSVIMLHDKAHNMSQYVYTSEVNFVEWVITQANAFKSNGYRIINNTNIVL